MADRAELISAYIQAKDCNRPWLMSQAFCNDARLEMTVKTDAISFPPVVSGLEGIADTLVRQFSRDNDNVYTFCLADAPIGHGVHFRCDWLVGMSRIDTGDVRVGCGHYDWTFADTAQPRVKGLAISIDVMQVLDRSHLQPVMAWLSGLSYPWCPTEVARRAMPDLAGLAPVARFLDRSG